jgi:hypothetical protein
MIRVLDVRTPSYLGGYPAVQQRRSAAEVCDLWMVEGQRSSNKWLSVMPAPFTFRDQCCLRGAGLKPGVWCAKNP